jgi:TRAP transporter TAXI family solute receptor
MLCALAAGTAATFAAGPALSAEISIGTGSRAGVYFQVGRAICRLVNGGTRDHGVSCTSPSTAGSIFNLTNVRGGKLQFGVAQSDWQFHALNGTSRFAEAGPDPDLRALFSVHGEPFTVVARRDAEIGTFGDLMGKRVNIGNPGSGQRATMEVVMEAMGWDKALCHDRVQAMIYTVGHPNASVGQAVALCDAFIVEVKGPEIDKLVGDNPFYAYTHVAGGIYRGNPDPVTTFGVKATVVTSAKTDDETVYTLVKTVFDNMDKFKKMHPAFGNLDPGGMITDGLSAPLHDGAMRYFSEQGLM